MSFAALGAGELLRDRPDEVCARQLLLDAVPRSDLDGADPAWPWPSHDWAYGKRFDRRALLLAATTLPDSALHGARPCGLLSFLAADPRPTTATCSVTAGRRFADQVR